MTLIFGAITRYIVLDAMTILSDVGFPSPVGLWPRSVAKWGGPDEGDFPRNQNCSEGIDLSQHGESDRNEGK